jgi:hypothetical protein
MINDDNNNNIRDKYDVVVVGGRAAGEPRSVVVSAS